jgi:hypothetical protein
MDVIDISELLHQRKQKAKEDALDTRVRNFHALHAELSSVVKRHERYGILPLGVVGACMQILAEYIVKTDPYLKHQSLRELLFEHLDRQTEEKLLAFWEEFGVDAPEEEE